MDHLSEVDKAYRHAQVFLCSFVSGPEEIKSGEDLGKNLPPEKFWKIRRLLGMHYEFV